MSDTREPWDLTDAEYMAALEKRRADLFDKARAWRQCDFPECYALEFEASARRIGEELHALADDYDDPMDDPRELPDTRDRDLPYDYDGEGVAGYLPELRDRGVRHDREDEDETGL